VVPLSPALTRVDGKPRRRKNILPTPFARRVGKFPVKRKRQMHTAEPVIDVLLMLRFDPNQMAPQRFSQI
jgi:hypothetical protein